jgi:hypothetical protein
VALEILPLDKSVVQEIAGFGIKNPLTKVEIRNIVKRSRAKSKDVSDLNSQSNCASHETELYLIDKTIRKSIAVIKSTYVSNFDDSV